MSRATFVTKKIKTHESTPWTKTIDFTVLHCTNVGGNNNKFYCIEIQEDPSTGNCRLFSHYGRLLSSDIYEVRETTKDGDSLTEDQCRTEYNKIIKKKQTGKNVKRGDETIREAYIVVDVVSPSVGSSNIRNASEVSVKGNNSPMVNTKNHDADSGRLIRTIVAENIHNITNNTTMTFTSRGFETPLGPVTENHLDKAVAALDAIRDLIGTNSTIDGTRPEVKEANSDYFSLVPRKFGFTIKTTDMVLNPDMLANEYDLVDNLRTAVRAGLNSGDKTDKGIDLQLALLPYTNMDARRLVDKYESSKHRNHSAIQGYKVKNIFTLNIPKVKQAYDPVAARLGNIHELFHGTKTANMLSISLNGLIIPPTGAAHVTGRMFGNGVYAASCSTKALNYAVGYWGGRGNSSSTAYMLIVNFAMGKEYVATSHLYSGAPKGYDSLWAKSGRALLNDEFIVYNLNQVNITHILELEK